MINVLLHTILLLYALLDAAGQPMRVATIGDTVTLHFTCRDSNGKVRVPDLTCMGTRLTENILLPGLLTWP